MKFRHVVMGSLSLLLAALLGVGVVLWRQYNQPLGPSLDLPSLAGTNPTTAPVAKSEPTGPAKVCGNTGSMTLLLIGSDLD